MKPVEKNVIIFPLNSLVNLAKSSITFPIWNSPNLFVSNSVKNSVNNLVCRHIKNSVKDFANNLKEMSK